MASETTDNDRARWIALYVLCAGVLMIVLDVTIVNVGLLAGFVAGRARIANPLMPLRLFRSRNVSGANAVMALWAVGMFGMFFLGALYMQRVLGYDALQVGLA